ncbi:MarR family winged helix-turn-helix transcriptional regulator [Actinoallomurus acanthiterrae]
MQMTKVRVDRLVAELPAQVWERLSCGDGVRGQRIYDWAAIDICPLCRPDWGHWLLARRSISEPGEIAYYVCFGPDGTMIGDLVRVAGTRWATEESFQTAKNETAATLKTLEAKGLVMREQDDWNRNSRPTRLTADGAQLVAEADATAGVVEQRMHDALDSDERATLRRLLAKCREAAGA